ncbi:antA/AntB antirepressor family protein [Campylobacter sp. RM9344]|uniref:AntA/AntB antirepressor family protein n=1 Tax=Campylobacter californiensis TaxID=1032243 RepID=A0AAW3ZW97_9BACT|nr:MULTISPECIES: antA/AntB antirepressor family protein [unclassified Campylobacter]MBE2985322.1 antA/AntB antirepressor family protein [Campylobacter sp. RM6883]MBE2995855.1 antA/AntB antirepressor family protein [Campylobacter sp. RM6913]MBE3030302.1 antA/AntB antirepressor family protein [Campylobacter sp. RM9344]MBE3608738.1 antA/AntB antirepressor family protein [Campylobacter sp. RM9337]QCD51252.1 AntA/AntB family antirepressor [Campylobacter sp. RM6914]
MNITIYNNQNIGAEINSANARELHCFLNSGQDYSDWIKNRITQYGFIENQDYIIQIVYTKGRPRKEYFITLDMAKELCMVENNDKGKEARQYFIKCEKELQALKFQHYVDKISALETGSRLESKHHQNQINGYLGQIAKHNQKIEVLKAELVLAKQSPNLYERIAMLELELKNAKADAHNYKLDMNFYMRKYRELKDESVKTENVSIKALDTIQGQMEHIFTAIGAVKSFINDGDEYFMREKGLLKG